MRCCSVVPSDHAEHRRDADERRRTELDLAVEAVGDRARDRRDEDRGERRRGGAALVEREQQHEQRHDHDPAADTEDRAEEACDEADRNAASARLVLYAGGSAHPAHRRAGTRGALLRRRRRARADRAAARGFVGPARDAARAASAWRSATRSSPASPGGRARSHARSSASTSLRYAGAARPRARAGRRRRGPTASTPSRAQWPWPWQETKPLTAAYHYRHAPDEAAAARPSWRPSRRRRSQQGCGTRWGRMVLEVLPPVDATKGTAVRHLLAESGLERALYAGDDTTDLDGFAALDGLEAAVRVAVVSAEGPVGARRARRPDRRLHRRLPRAAAAAVGWSLEPEPLAQLPRLAACDVELGLARRRRAAGRAGPATARRTPATLLRLTRYERWMRAKRPAGSLSSSSPSDAVQRYERS